MDRDACISESNRPHCVQYVCCLIYPGSVIDPNLAIDRLYSWVPLEGEDSVSRFMHTMFP
jgi:hypothetical protein